MMNKHIYLGFDAGGTRTTVFATSSQSDHPAYENDAPGINLYRTPPRQALGIIQTLIYETRKHFKTDKIDAVCMGLAGASHEENKKLLRQELLDEFPELAPDRLELTTDTEIALEGAFDGESGVLVVVGTGSNVLARTENGKLVQSGGWGYLLGDEASGMVLGLAGLRVLVHAFESGEFGILPDLIRKRLNIECRNTLLEKVYRSSWPVQDVAPVVLEAAELGDADATMIVERQVTALASNIHRVFESPQSIRHRVAIVGGLSNNPFFLNHLTDAICELDARVEIVKPLHTPVRGAWQRALRLPVTDTIEVISQTGIIMTN